MPVRFANNATASLATGINASVTSLTVAAGMGALLPVLAAGQNFPVTVEDEDGMEVMRCTARSGDTLTVVRAQEGTTARSFAVGAAVQARITAAVLNNFVQKDEAAAISNVVRGSNGTAAAPTFSFTADTNVGMYRIGADILGLSTGGVERVRVSTTNTQISTTLSVVNGTAAAPAYSFTADPGTGFYRYDAGVLACAAAGTLVAAFGTVTAWLGTDLTLEKASPTVNLTATSGNAGIEVGAASGGTAYIDLKVPSADDYDIRLATTGAGGSLTSAGGLVLISGASNNINYNAGNGWHDFNGQRIVAGEFLLSEASNDTGFYSYADGSIGWKCNGVYKGRFNDGGLNVAGNIQAGGHLYVPGGSVYPGSGGAVLQGDGNLYMPWASEWLSNAVYWSSDETLKKNIAPSAVSGSSVVRDLEFIAFDWDEEAGETAQAGHVEVGISAQALQIKHPGFVREKADGTLAVKPHDFTMLLAKTSQETLVEIANLKQRMAAVEEQLPDLTLPVPKEVTNFQARAVLMQIPVGDPGQTAFDLVNAWLQAEGGIAWQAWEYANVISRSGLLVSSVASQLGWSETDLDQMFIDAARIEA